LTVSKRTLLAGSAAIAAVVIAGGAIAATKLTSPKEANQAIINDAAGQLGIEPSKLSDALKKALKTQVDKQVAVGRLTKEQGDALKARIDADEVPLFATPGFRFGPHGFGLPFRDHGPFRETFSTAADYLAMSEADLLKAVRNGKSLAEVAKAKGKTAAGLIDALVAAAGKKWDEAVAAGKFKDHTSAADRQEFLAGIRDRVTHLVNDRFPPRPDWHDFRHGPGFFPPHR
jgi:hypothetical protein